MFFLNRNSLYWCQLELVDRLSQNVVCTQTKKTVFIIRKLTNLSQVTAFTVFSIESGNRRISPDIAIKSPAMNFSSMGLMFKTKSSFHFYFNSVRLSFAGMYSRIEHGNSGLKTNLSV